MSAKSETVKTSVKKNFIYNLLYQVLVMVVPFVTAPYISRVLGAQRIGVYGYTVSISAYFILFGCAGTSLYGQRQIAFFQGERKHYSKVFWEIFSMRFLGMLLSGIVFAVCFICPGGKYQYYYLVLLLELLGNAIDITWFFQGLELFGRTVLRNAIIKCISVVSIFCFVKRQEDLMIYFLIYVLSLLFGNLSLWVGIHRYLERIHIRELCFKEHCMPILRMFIPQAAVQLYTIFDKTMLGLLIEDKSEVGYYEQAQKLVKTSVSVVTALGTVMLPHIANRHAKGDKKGIASDLTKSFLIVTAIAMPVMLGIIVVAESFVPWYYGNGFEPVVQILQIISPIIFLIGISNVTGIQYLLPTKQETKYTVSVVAGAGINIAANCILIPVWGAIGASFGTVLAELTVAAVQIYITRGEIAYMPVVRNMLRIWAAGGMMTVCCLFVRWFMETGFGCFAAQFLVGGAVYGICMFLWVIPKLRKQFEA